MQRLIAAGGKVGAGKDYMLERLCRYEAGQDGRVIISGFGDLIRSELSDDATRRDQQIHGQLRRQEDENYWTKKAVQWGQWAIHEGGYAVAGFSGVRFENEIQVLQDGGFWVGLIEAPEEIRRQRLYDRDGRVWTPAELNDVTETSLDRIPHHSWDFVWDNA